MPTLEEILNNSLGLGSESTQEKTAAQEPVDAIEKLAMELGLDDSDTGSTPQTKEAEMSLNNLYNDLFPEDAPLNKITSADEQVSNQEELEKIAAYEEAVGARAFDHFAARVDARLEKIAEAAISDDSTPPQQLPNNKAGGNASINTTPQIDNELPAEKGQAVVGEEEQKKVAAVRKHMLLAMLEE